MSKFTSEEVEALQNGGNQRAREIFLKEWDPQSERLPNNSNPEKVRQFIKDVYVDRKYAGENNSGKPPKDKQKSRNHEDETRRASSYHSYSQSPPYDYQYEERRYGKQAATLSRKPGSDRGIYEKKAYGFMSPSHLSDEKSRVSDYSVSSDPFRSHPQSPTFQTEVGYSSPSSTEISRDISVNTSADIKGPPLQRSASVDNGLSSNLANSSSNVKSLTSSVSVNFDGLDLFNPPFVSQNAASTAAPIDLFQLPHASSTSLFNLFQPSNPNENTLPQNSPSLCTDQPKQESNEGWATFDKPQISEQSQAVDSFTPTTIQEKHDQLIFPTFQEAFPLPTPNQWDADFGNFDTHLNGINSQQPWNAFEDSSVSFNQQWNSQAEVQDPSSIDDQYHGFGIPEAHRPERISTNPFDLPFDSDMDPGNMFLELRSLQNALPNGPTLTQPWFPQDPVDPFAPQGTLGFMGSQVPNSQIQNVATHTPVASIGGNPFA
jgi:hypothetical protein